MFASSSTQPTDLSLSPHTETSSNDPQSVPSVLSSAVDALTSLLLLSASSKPDTLRVVSAKPARSLSVWEKSLLASKGRLRTDEADPAMLSLFPVNAALGSLVSRIVSSELVALDSSDRFVSSF